MQRLEVAHQFLGEQHMVADFRDAVFVFVIIGVQRAGGVIQRNQIQPALLVAQFHYGVAQQAVMLVVPAAAFGQRLDGLGGGAPDFFGGLLRVAGVQFGLGLLQQLAAHMGVAGGVFLALRWGMGGGGHRRYAPAGRMAGLRLI